MFDQNCPFHIWRPLWGCAFYAKRFKHDPVPSLTYFRLPFFFAIAIFDKNDSPFKIKIEIKLGVHVKMN